MFIAVAVFTAFQLFQYCIELLVFLTPFERIVALRFQCLNLLHGMTEDKDIFFTDFFSNFDICAIQRTDSERTIKSQFHIARARSLFPSSRDLLRDIRRRDQHFRRRDTVIRQEHHFQLVTHFWIVVDHFSHFIDRKNNVLRQIVARRGFRPEQEHTRYAVSLRVFANLFVQRQNMQQIQVLPFVLVQTFNLDVENCLRVDFNTSTRFYKLCQTNFIRLFDFAILLAEFRVISEFFQINQLIEIVSPLFFQRFIQQRRQCRVALFDPATRSNTISDVMEFVRPQLVVFREQIFHHQIRVQRRHAIHRKAANHTHIGHTNLFVMYHRQFRPYRLVARPGLFHQLLKAVIDFVDYLHMAWQQRFNQLLIPALQCFWHQGMVGISEGFTGDCPGVIPAHLVLIYQYTQQFRNGNSRVCVVKLNDFVIRQLVQFTPRQMMATKNVSNRTGALEVLLHQAQFFTGGMVVVWIENFSQFFRVDALLFSTQEITVIKFGKIERMSMSRLPQT